MADDLMDQMTLALRAANKARDDAESKSRPVEDSVMTLAMVQLNDRVRADQLTIIDLQSKLESAIREGANLRVSMIQSQSAKDMADAMKKKCQEDCDRMEMMMADMKAMHERMMSEMMADKQKAEDMCMKMMAERDAAEQRAQTAEAKLMAMPAQQPARKKVPYNVEISRDGDGLIAGFRATPIQ